MRRATSFALALCVALLAPSAASAEMPDAAAASDADIKAAIDAAVQSAAAAKSSDGAEALAADEPPSTRKPIVRREPREHFHHYRQSEASKYPELSKRHLLLFSPSDQLAENERILLEAAELILNPPTPLQAGEKGGNTGGGKVLFLLVDASDPENAGIMHRCSVPAKTTKSGVLRLAQFPTTRPLEIFKPVGKYVLVSRVIHQSQSDNRQ